jgi:phosphatidylglycerol:prolipoprotein diacylglycerol transferase
MFLAWQFQSPGPIIWEIGPLAIRWYGLLIASAVLIGFNLSKYLAKRRQVKPELIEDLIIWLILGSIFGARLYYVLFKWQDYSQNPGEIFAIWHGGIAIHGAIIAGVIVILIFARIHKVSFWQIVDLIAPSLILGQSIGRWGNFFNSEAFGDPTNLPWKLYIPPANRPLELIQFEYFHPTFLYESLWNIGVFVLLMWLFFWGLKHPGRLKVGTITFIYLIAYSSGRIWIEGLRTDSLMLGPLRIAQVVSLVAIAFGLLGLIWLYFFKLPLPDPIKEQN